MNPAIEAYIHGLFTSLPHTEEIRRARSELLAMSEDKYSELIDDGLTESEATGRVITEFGSLEEVADALGIREVLTDPSPAPGLARAEVEAAIGANRRASLLVALGVLVILSSFAVTTSLLQDAGEVWTALVFLPAVAIAVGLFITATVINRPAAQITSGRRRPDSSDIGHWREHLERQTWPWATGLIVGIALVLLSLAFTVFAQARWGQAYAPAAFFGTVGLGIGTIIVVGMRRSLLTTLADPDRVAGAAPSPGGEEVPDRLGLIAPIYWMTMVVVYLGWSFLADAWHISWVIWPVAGICFAILAAVLNAVSHWRAPR